jgi:putative addiction module component (TIGR02574 family)
MRTTELAKQIRRLSVADRVRLIGDIWEGIHADSEPPPLTEAQRSELARRIAEHKRDPSSAIPADRVIAELRKRYG